LIVKTEIIDFFHVLQPSKAFTCARPNGTREAPWAQNTMELVYLPRAASSESASTASGEVPCYLV